MSDPVDTTDHGSDGIPQHAAPEEPGSGADELAPVETEIPAEEPPRPEPVLDAARLAGLVGALVIALTGVVAVVVGGNILGSLDALGNSISGLFIAVSALVAYVLPMWQARKARAKVTPLADPRDAAGRPLLTTSEET